MKIMLIGGGSGGHITPLLAVARELKQIDKDTVIIGVCEKGSNFTNLYKDCSDIDNVKQISAGKYRRYGNYTRIQRVLDVETWLLNFRDVFLTIAGYRQSIRYLKKQKPDALLMKGGFVAVPMGLAAARLKIPFITHDSDSTPGLANRMISRWASYNATGMPAELYSYPKSKLRFTGIPLSKNFTKVNDKLRSSYREQLGIKESSLVLTIVGGSLGGTQLNIDIANLSKGLLDSNKNLVIVHVAGNGKVEETVSVYKAILSEEEFKRVNISGFVSDIYVRQGAGDIVITRAGATQTAELAIQCLPIIIVPADLAGGHQDKNANFFAKKEAAIAVKSGDRDDLLKSINALLKDKNLRSKLSSNLFKLSKPEAAKELAELVVTVSSENIREK